MFHTELVAKKAALIDAYSAYKNAEREYMVAATPRYVSILQWCDENEIDMSYTEMKQLAELARAKSLLNAKPIKMGSTPIGTLYCFLENIVFSAFDEMTDGEDFGDVDNTKL